MSAILFDVSHHGRWWHHTCSFKFCHTSSLFHSSIRTQTVRSTSILQTTSIQYQLQFNINFNSTFSSNFVYMHWPAGKHLLPLLLFSFAFVFSHAHQGKTYLISFNKRRVSAYSKGRLFEGGAYSRGVLIRIRYINTLSITNYIYKWQNNK